MSSKQLIQAAAIAITIISLPVSTHGADKPTSSLQKHFQENPGYRNRYYAGWAFFWLLVVIGLFVLLNPRQKGPGAR